jgi:hypothetical protein
VVPCKGRLGHLQQTAPSVLSHPGVHYCLVDYSCPERSGAWFESVFGGPIAERRAMVHRISGRPGFNKSAAHNAGAWAALQRGAESICFLDADTLTRPGFFEFVSARVRPGRFLIAGLNADGADQPSLTGVLALSAREFSKSGGFDESYEGWGGEDIEFRLRLCLLHGLDHVDIPLPLVAAIPHDNRLRTRFYTTQSPAESNARNMAKTRHKVWHEWAGRRVRAVEQAERLWFHGAAVRARALAARAARAQQPAAPSAASPPVSSAVSSAVSPTPQQRRAAPRGAILRKLQRRPGGNDA